MNYGWIDGGGVDSYGAMITRAPEMGRDIPSMEEGTWESQVSSSDVRVDARELYHEPAWLATRVVMLAIRYWDSSGLGFVCEELYVLEGVTI